MKLLRTCPLCNEEHELELTPEEEAAVEKYQLGGYLIQQLLPNTEPIIREFIKSGYCSPCQSLLFNSKPSKRIKKTI